MLTVYDETNRTFADVWAYYRGLRWSNLRSPRYRHLFWLLYWPVYGLMFLLLERVFPLNFHPIACALDDYIPFCEYFVIPYYFWFVLLIGMVAYTLLFNIPAFRRMMQFIVITYTVTVVIYLVYPSMQELRPETFPRDNIFTRIVAGLYAFDTNTNVCPSLHVLGSVAACLGGLECRRFSSLGWRIALVVSATVVSFSTVFLKQHSIIDVIVALALSVLAYLVVYARRPRLEAEAPAAEKEEKTAVEAAVRIKTDERI